MYLDMQFLEISRAFKKRATGSSTLPTLESYLSAVRPLMSIILLIPPIDPSTALRTELLLKLTGDVLDAVTSYPPTSEALPLLRSWLDELDKGWVAVLEAQLWDPETGKGKDVAQALPNMLFSPTVETMNLDIPPGTPIYSSTPVSQTESTRLSSLLEAACDSIEEWLETIGEQEHFRDVFFRRTFKILEPRTPVWRAHPQQSQIPVVAAT